MPGIMVGVLGGTLCSETVIALPVFYITHTVGNYNNFISQSYTE